jgi:xylulokinase
MADMLGVELLIKENSDSSLGSAMLAGVAVGVFSSFNDSVKKCVRVTDSVKPNPETVELYNKGFQFYQKIKDALDPIYVEMEQKL